MNFLTLIKKEGYTCIRLSEELGVSRQSLYNWVYGKSTPNPKTILQIAEILKVPEKEILLCFAENN